MEGAEGGRSSEEVVAEGERDHQDGGGEGEAEEGGEATGKTAAQEAEGKAGLAACWAGDGLSEGDDLGIGFFAAPGAAVDELSLEVAEVGDGAAKAGAAEAQEDEEDLGPGVRSTFGWHARRVSLPRELRVIALPVVRAGGAFEGAGDVGGDPAAIEVAGLRDDAFAVDGAFVDAIGVEGYVVAEFGVGGRRLNVAPGGVGADGAWRAGEIEERVKGEVDVPISGEAFEFAQAAMARGRLEEMHGDVGVGDVVDGRVAGLENAEGARGFGEEDAAMNDANVVVNEFKARRAGIVPHGFVW